MRARKTRRGVALAIGMCLLTVRVASYAVDPVKRCEADKLVAAGNRQACLAMEQAEAVLGKSSDPARCEAEFDADLARADAKAAKQGVACRFLDNQDGTISDLNTLLMWEKKDQAGLVHDVDNVYTWAEAAELGPESEWEVGHGWDSRGVCRPHRLALADLAELRTILVAEFPNCPGSPCVDPVFNDGVNSFTAESKYWSSTTTTFIQGTRTSWISSTA